MKRNPPPNNARRVRHIQGNEFGNMYSADRSILQFESGQMRTHLMSLLRDPLIVSIVTEPFTIEFFDSKGRKRKYTPDCKVKFADGHIEIHEVTVSDRREKENSIEREKAARQYCQARGWIYRVFTEKDLPQKTELANLRALYPFRRPAYYSRAVEDAIVDILNTVPRMKVVDLIAAIEFQLSLPKNVIFSALCHAAWHLRVVVDSQHLIFFRGMPNPKLWTWLPSSDRGV